MGLSGSEAGFLVQEEAHHIATFSVANCGNIGLLILVWFVILPMRLLLQAVIICLALALNKSFLEYNNGSRFYKWYMKYEMCEEN